MTPIQSAIYNVASNNLQFTTHKIFCADIATSIILFMFNDQLNQNTGCKVKSVVNMKRQFKRLSNRRRSEQPFYVSQVYPSVTPPMMPG